MNRKVSTFTFIHRQTVVWDGRESEVTYVWKMESWIYGLNASAFDKFSARFSIFCFCTFHENLCGKDLREIWFYPLIIVFWYVFKRINYDSGVNHNNLLFYLQQTKNTQWRKLFLSPPSSINFLAVKAGCFCCSSISKITANGKLLFLSQTELLLSFQLLLLLTWRERTCKVLKGNFKMDNNTTLIVLRKTKIKLSEIEWI